MKLLNYITLAISCGIASSAMSWNYTVNNLTPYHLITSFVRIAGIFDNPVVLAPGATSTVSSWVGPIDYCYSGFHLLVQPTAWQSIPSILFNGSRAAITEGKMPNINALQQLKASIDKGAKIGAATGAAIGSRVGAVEGALTGGFLGFAAGNVTGAGVGAAIDSTIGSGIGLIGGLIAITKNEVAYKAPWISIPGDACWNKIITLYYDASSNQIIVSVE
jgi:hypothetical protein